MAIAMFRYRAYFICALVWMIYGANGFAQTAAVVSEQGAIRVVLDMGIKQGWEVLYGGLDGSPRGPDVVFRDPVSKVIHVFESKANQSPLRTYYGHLQGTRDYTLHSAWAAINQDGLTAAQRDAYQAVLATGNRSDLLRTYVARSRVFEGQAIGAPAVKEMIDASTNTRQYMAASGKVLAHGIALWVISMDVIEGAQRAIEIERLYDERQLDTYHRDLEQVRNAAKTGGHAAGTLAGLWFGIKAGTALGSLAGSVAGPVGSTVAATTGAVIVGVAFYLAGEAAAVFVSEFIYHRVPDSVHAAINEVQPAYEWVESTVLGLWEGSWVQTAYHWVANYLNWVWQGSYGWISEGYQFIY